MSESRFKRLPPWRSWPWELLPLLLGLAYLYRRTMPPGISSWIVEGWDSAVLQVTGSTWGVPHSPGYPLYTIFANLFVRGVGLFAPGSAAVWRVSLWSTTTSLLTLATVYLIVRVTSESRVGALIAVAWLGLSFIFWRAAIMAEVYSLNGLIFALAYALVLGFDRARAAGREPDGGRRWLIALGLVLGAGLVHHRTAFILPVAVALWLLVGSPNFRQAARNIALTGVVATLPLVTYLYLPLAAQARLGQTWLYADTSQWNVFWFVVVAREWWGLVQPPVGLAAWAGALETLFRQQAGQITPAGVVLGLAGLAGLRRYRLLFGVSAIAFVLFAASYRVVDLDSMLIPLTLTLVIGLGTLLGRGLTWLGRRGRLGRRLGAGGSLILVAAAFVLLRPLAQANYHQVDLSQDWQAEDLVEEVVAVAGAGTPLAIIGQDNSVLPDFIYAQAVLEQPLYPLSTTTLARLPEAEGRATVQAQLEAGRRVLIDRETLDLRMIPWLNQAIEGGNFFVAPTGHPYLWELVPLPFGTELPPRETVQAQPSGDFPDGVPSLAGFHQRLLRKRTGCFLRLTLFWQARTGIAEDYFVAVQPEGEAAIAKNDHLGLMRGYLATSSLTPGAVIRDEVDLPVREPQLLPGLRLRVNLYQVRGNEFPTFGQATLPITVDPAACEG
ncbi:MAG: protein O-mannosyl-transferase family [Anaerolineae bacterium]